MTKRMRTTDPLADAMLGQTLIGVQAGRWLFRCFDPLTFVNLDGVEEACAPRREPRLNPLEFHGRRQPQMQRRLAPAHSSVRDWTAQTHTPRAGSIEKKHVSEIRRFDAAVDAEDLAGDPA